MQQTSMHTLPDSLNIAELFLLASGSVPGQPRCSFASSPDDQDAPWCVETSGGSLFVLAFERRPTRLVVRFPVDDNDVSWWMWSKQALQFISRSFDSFPAPRVYHSCLEENNPVGVPFMILDWIEGMSMPQWRPGLPPNESARMQFLDQFSDAFLDLVLTPLTDRSGNDIEYYGIPEGTPRGRRVSASRWVTESVDRVLRRAFDGHNLHGANIVDYLLQRSLVPLYIVDEYDNAPWVLMHCDMHHNNIITDDGFNLKGIIDWDFTFPVPLQKACAWPKLLHFTPGLVPPGADSAFMTQPTDQQYFLLQLKEKEIARRGSSVVSSLMESSFERNFFELSLHFVTVHREWVATHPHPADTNMRAQEALTEFLAANPAYLDNDVLVKLQKELESTAE